MAYAEIFEGFPPELRLPIARLVDTLREELGTSRADIDELKAIVRELAQAQARTEARLEALAQAQQRTELRVEELAQAQQRTEIGMQELRGAVRQLAEVQTQFQRTFNMQIGGLGARWGMQTEEAFRQGMRTILHEVGFTSERFLDYDATGEIFGHPDQVELDVVIKDGRAIVVEIKSALDSGNTYIFDRKVAFYMRKTGRQVDRKLIVTPYADNRAKEVGLRLGVEICTDITMLQ
jgi:hypothetical protein